MGVGKTRIGKGVSQVRLSSSERGAAGGAVRTTSERMKQYARAVELALAACFGRLVVGTVWNSLIWMK